MTIQEALQRLGRVIRIPIHNGSNQYAADLMYALPKIEAVIDECSRNTPDMEIIEQTLQLMERWHAIRVEEGWSYLGAGIVGVIRRAP